MKNEVSFSYKNSHQKRFNSPLVLISASFQITDTFLKALLAQGSILDSISWQATTEQLHWVLLHRQLCSSIVLAGASFVCADLRWGAI